MLGSGFGPILFLINVEILILLKNTNTKIKIYI